MDLSHLLAQTPAFGTKTPTEGETPSKEARSLEAIFEADPLEWTGNDIETIIAEFQRQRPLWEAEKADAAKTGRRAQAKKVTVDIKTLDLNDLLPGA